MNRHELFLNLLAYKSIDSEARSRRRNLVFHGLAEIVTQKLGKFLWEEMSIDTDDLYIEQVHRLRSIQKARQRVTGPNEPVRRPIIVAFNDSRSVNRVLDNAHMLRGSRFSVKRDFPSEIVKARRTLMPQCFQEKQNRQSKVSIEYPARLVVNGKTVCDIFRPGTRYCSKFDTTLGQSINMNISENAARVDFVQSGPQ